MHAVVRRWSNASALGDTMVSRRQEVEDLLRGVPGFVAYFALRDGDEVATITVCNDLAGTQESTRRAAEWVKQNLAGAPPSAPEVFEGETFIQLEA